MRKIKDNLGTFIATLFALLIPMLAGVILWKQLPNEVATHWGVDGNPDVYSSKAFAVFGMPIFILIIHLIASLVTAKKDTTAISDKLFCLLLWICPVMSIVVATLTYATALGHKVNVPFWALMLVGIIYIVLGNYLPKARQNRFFGMRVKWTLESKKNWEHTNRFSAKIMVALGFCWIICAVLWIFAEMKIAVVVLIVGTLMGTIFAMTLYSYLYYLKHNQDKDYF